jgi:hypothetical protein
MAAIILMGFLVFIAAAFFTSAAAEATNMALGKKRVQVLKPHPTKPDQFIITEEWDK